MKASEQLREQNNGVAWLDCNAHGLPHRWKPGAVDLYWTCQRCPVDTRNTLPGFKPKPFLREQNRR